MPRNVRNFWIELDVDGSKSRIETGPRAADGGFSMKILMRDGDSIVTAATIDGFGANDDGIIMLRVKTAGEEHETRTKR